MGSGNSRGRTGTGLWPERGSPLLGTPGLSPAPEQAHWEEEICLCQVVSLGPARMVEITLTLSCHRPLCLMTK